MTYLNIRKIEDMNNIMITHETIDNWFKYHAPDDLQIVKYGVIRETAKSLAMVIIDNTPESADQTAALRKLRECVMTANASIACKGI